MDLLQQARSEIDRIDAEMAALFERRMRAVADVARYKAQTGKPVFDAVREAAVLEKNAARLQAERELEQLASGGAMGVLCTLAGGKAARQEAARQELRRAKEEDQKAAWDLAEAQGQLLETERELASLEGCEAAFAQARRERIAALRAAGSGLESGYSRGRACPISGSDTLSRKNSVSELSPVYRGVREGGRFLTHLRKF